MGSGLGLGPGLGSRLGFVICGPVHAAVSGWLRDREGRAGRAGRTLYAPWYCATSSPITKTLSSLFISSLIAELSASRTVICTPHRGAWWRGGLTRLHGVRRRTCVGTLHMLARCSIPSRGSRLLVVLDIMDRIAIDVDLQRSGEGVNGGNARY